jgi:hypothetical protein
MFGSGKSAELMLARKDTLVISLKVSYLISASFPLFYFALEIMLCVLLSVGFCQILLALVQNKLEGLVAQHTDVLESLTPKVVKFVDALREI